MITSVAGPVSAPVHVRPVQPAVEAVAAVTAPGTSGSPGTPPRGGQQPDTEARVRTVDSPPQPVSTQSVLLLRQSGASIAGIAEAYGMSVDAIRRLLHVEDAGRPAS